MSTFYDILSTPRMTTRNAHEIHQIQRRNSLFLIGPANPSCGRSAYHKSQSRSLYQLPFAVTRTQNESTQLADGCLDWSQELFKIFQWLLWPGKFLEPPAEDIRGKDPNHDPTTIWTEKKLVSFASRFSRTRQRLSRICSGFLIDFFVRPSSGLTKLAKTPTGRSSLPVVCTSWNLCRSHKFHRLTVPRKKTCSMLKTWLYISGWWYTYPSEKY